MKIGSAFKKMVEQARLSPEYWAAGIAIGFAVSVDALMKRKHINRSELARKMGTSLPYVTKVMRGDANFTLETMAKVAMALNATVDVRLVDNDASAFIVKPVACPSDEKRPDLVGNFTPIHMQPANECTRDIYTATTSAA